MNQPTKDSRCGHFRRYGTRCQDTASETREGQRKDGQESEVRLCQRHAKLHDYMAGKP